MVKLVSKIAIDPILLKRGNYFSVKKAYRRCELVWRPGRGKSVVCEPVIKKEVVHKVLKTSVEALVELNKLKNLIGSNIVGALGGFNAHASNIVSASHWSRSYSECGEFSLLSHDGSY